MIRVRAIVGMILALPFSAAAQAHDLKGLHNVVAHEQIASASARASASTGSLALKYVFKTFAVLASAPRALDLLLGWKHRTAKGIVTAMKTQWPVASLTNGVLSYDEASFSNPPSCRSTDPKVVGADIRVAFKGGPDGGDWSYVGTESLGFVPSMNFELI